MNRDSSLLEVKDLAIHFPTSRGVLKAVDGVSFDLKYGEVLGLVGESGAGKSVTGRAIMKLVPPPGKIVSGRVMLEGIDILTLRDEDLRSVRGKKVALIQQDPLSSLNPVFKIKDQIMDILKLNLGLSHQEAYTIVADLLKEVGIPDSATLLEKYPHELSGGMRQRVCIAIAFSCTPLLVIADEPTTAVDVITQLQIIQLMRKIQREKHTSILFITHNLALASKICDKIAVMYAGRIVELSLTKKIFESPIHPYTRALLDAVPRYDAPERLQPIEGDAPNLIDLPTGCSFYPRCREHQSTCLTIRPSLLEVKPDHYVACQICNIL
jgi:oligopeptide transport system ATP-binding protein